VTTPAPNTVTIEEVFSDEEDHVSRIQLHQGIEVDCARLPPDIPFGDRNVHRDDFGDWDKDNPATSHGYHSRAEWEKSCRAAEWCTQHPVLMTTLLEWRPGRPKLRDEIEDKVWALFRTHFPRRNAWS
jgi:hypothetical protein